MVRADRVDTRVKPVPDRVGFGVLFFKRERLAA
jgi:hypothetical protein